MGKTTHRFTAGIALLLIGLSLITAVILTAPRIVRANPGVLYAAPAAQGSGDCSSWANACTLQTALTNAVSGDEIWVQASVHYPGVASNRSATFTLKNGVALYGGFAGTETSRDQRNWQTNKTILSGDIDQNDINSDGNSIAETWNDIQGENAYHVVTGSGTDATAVLDGFVITAGQANGADSDGGGGGMLNHPGSPALSHVTFSGNFAEGNGAGMYNWASSSPTLVQVTFVGNRSNSSGGGMFNDWYTTPILRNVVLSGNSAFQGGGMFNYIYSQPTLVNLVFSGNSAGYGGGMFNEGSQATLVNITFEDNTAEGGGGGMYNKSSSPTLVNITFSGNTANIQGGGMVNEWWSSRPTLTNVILWGNNAPTGPEIHNYYGNPTISYSDIQGCGGSGAGWNAACGADGGGNIEADPLFVDAGGGDLRLQLTSPAIDAGNNATVPPGVTTDLDGNPRFVDIPSVPDSGNGAPPLVDMGAYEAQYLDVALGKAVVPQAVAPSQAITFTLALTNAGSLPATGIVVTDTLPAWLWGASFTSTLSITDTGYLPPYV